MQNATPQGRVSLRLLVSVGSLYESASQRGIAHFIEHMAFRGTRHFPHGKLLPMLERMGMGFGADSTAFTGYDYTEYRLELPDTDPATVRSGLEVLRDFAGEITFDRAALDIERGVVLSEVDLRRTPQWGLTQSNLEYLWPHSRLAARSPGGLKTLLLGYGPEDLRAFYNVWYRPERMALIAVGDVDATRLAKLVGATFASLRARGLPSPEPLDLYPTFAAPSNVAVFREPGWTGASLLLEHVEEDPPAPSTRARRAAELHAQMAMAMFQRRLEISAASPAAVFAGPQASSARSVLGWNQTTVSLSVAVSDLPEAVREIEQQHRRAFLYGFSPVELAIVQGADRAALRDGVRTAGTRNSQSLAEQIESHLLYGAALLSPQQAQDEYLPLIEATTTRDCLQAFRGAWTVRAPNVLLELPPQVWVQPQQLARAFNASRAEAVQRPPPEQLGTFDYANFGPVSALQSDRYVKDLDLHLARYANGVALNFKPTTFEADQVTVVVRVGGGRSTVPVFSTGLPEVTSAAFLRGGVGEFSSRELQDILSGHDFQVGFVVDHDAFCFYGRSAREELPLALRFIAAYITDPAFRPEELHDIRVGLGHGIIDETQTADGLILHRFQWLLTGQGDWRCRPPDWPAILAADYGAMATWLMPQLRAGPVEVTLVGDLSWSEARKAMEQSLAQLRPRPPPALGALGAPLQPMTRGPLRAQFTTAGVVRQACLCLLWDLPGIVQMGDQRRGYMAAAVLQERVLERLRIELGRTYSPTVEFGYYDAPRGQAYLEIRLDLAPPLVGPAYRIIQQEVATLSAHPPSPDVFARAREPLLREIRDSMRTNSYWAFTVLQRACELPDDVDAPRTRAADYESITAEDVSRFLRAHVGDRDLSVIVTTPQAGR